MSTLSIEGHEFTAHSAHRGDLIIREAGCSCGNPYEWSSREEQHEAHVLDEQRKIGVREVLEMVKANRERLASLSQSFTAERVTYIEGQESALEALQDEIEEALR